MSDSLDRIGPNGPSSTAAADAPQTTDGAPRERVGFLLLMRHMSDAKICAQGKEIGERLREYIEETAICDELKITNIDCLRPTNENDLAAKTAAELIQVFNSRVPEGGNPKRQDPKITDKTDFSKVYGDDSLNPYSKIANPYFGHQIDRRQSKEQLQDLEAFLRSLCEKPIGGANARLVVGHSPEVDWLLHRLVESPWYWRWLWSYQHSFVPGEVICVQLDQPTKGTPHGRAIWSLAPTDDDTEGLLREKIRGKMESAKLLGGIVGAGLGFVLAGFHDLAFGWSSMMDDWARNQRCIDEKAAAAMVATEHAAKAAAATASPVRGEHAADATTCVLALDGDRLIPFAISIAALAIAAGLYWFAYLSYDRLLMPTRFWTAPALRESWLGDKWRWFDRGWRRVAWRPPSSSLLIMHQNMQRIWFSMFIPASLLTGIALLLLAYAATIQPFADWFRAPWTARLWLIGGSVAIVLILAVWRHCARPILGAQD